ncbi:LOW QUALITY PROTEIN: hypothetical protein U9M48_031847 [Paspalum notatum var. saurae]|uniref:Integrase catalytic domain-containing protein n=1 Tax=Paspalum notatum var. saurae TaxID=547442 RepID=A0AAQ3U7P1_PASNO
MESKDEAFDFVRNLVLRLRNESHKAMRAIRSDNGGEFRNSRFENFCRDLGLEHQFSSPYTPSQNGIVERKNRTLVEMARMMLDEHRTPRRFWAEAVNTACYIANQIFLRAFLGKISRHPIFEDEEGAVDVGDAGATATAAAPAPSAMSSDDEGGPLPMASSSLPRQRAQAEAGPAEDAGEVTSEIVPSQQVQRDHPPHRMIGDIHQRVTRSTPPPNCRPIGIKWVFKNKQGENGMVVRNKARLKEGIDYEEAFAPAARLEAIRILLAFAPSKGFKLQKMDVKSVFLNGFIELEVYVRQSPSFESARFPDRSFLLKSGFVMGSVDKTLFLLSRGDDTLIIYIDDIIFGGSSHALVSSFAEQMSREFEMSLMDKQDLEGTFVHQAKYTRDILKKFDMGDSKPMTTPMSTNTALDADEDREAVDQKEFRGMIGSLLYLTATRPDIQFAAFPRTSHHQAVKRIFRYLKFTPKLGLWYSSGSSLSLRGFSDADHASCRIDRKSTSGTCQLLGTSLVSWSSHRQASVALSTTEAEYVAAASCCS